MPCAPRTSATLPATLRLIGEALAGRGFDGEVEQGEAVRIFTGAPVPEGADTMVIQENTERDGGVVTVKEAAPAGHIRPRGLDFSKGECCSRRPPARPARADRSPPPWATPSCPCAASRSVAILATGDELVPPGTDARPRSDRLLRTSGLAALVEAQGGEAHELGIARDTRESLDAPLASAGSGADILVTIGGASVGDHDLVGAVLRAEAWSSTSGRSPCGRASRCCSAASATARAGPAGQPGVLAGLRARVPGAADPRPARAAPTMRRRLTGGPRRWRWRPTAPASTTCGRRRTGDPTAEPW